MTMNLSNVALDICKDMHAHRQALKCIVIEQISISINRPQLKSPQAEVNYSVLVYILSLMIMLIQRAH